MKPLFTPAVRHVIGCLALGWFATVCVIVPAAAPTVSFQRDVAPILTKRCFACHGPDTAESGVALDSFKGATAESDSGMFAIVAGSPEESELLRRTTSEEDYERMPPEGPALKPEEIATLRAWIESGAEYEQHWAFKKPGKFDPPAVNNADWARNDIDRFVLAKLEVKGLTPAPEADRRTLIRRLYYDLVGLPPTTEEVEVFAHDESPDAYEKLVDTLLASPHHGEKWARHWLDVVRYGETNSFERDGAKPNVWKYRDYVIRSLNEDKPYDQFVREQIAGDELDASTGKGVTDDSIIATGYYRLGIWDDEPADELQAKADEMDSLVSTTSQAFLGLTVGCARCHDHKIDPIPQKDYYGMVAFFGDVTPYGARGDQSTNSQWDLSGKDIKQTRRQLRRKQRALTKESTALEQAAIARMPGEEQRRTETEERELVLEAKLADHQTEAERELYEDLKRQLAGVEAELAALPPANQALALARCEPHPAPTHVHLRGNPHVPDDEVGPRFPELFEDEQPAIEPAPEGARSAGRRRVLADWIASPDNRLTSRVIANRVWQHHFGRGIVRSASNFGQLGTPPTHPELLDWLAGWLVEHGWRLKPLHKLIVTSSAYRMSSAPNAEALAVDPANDLFWRFDLRRLTAEEVRDSALAVSGQLIRTVYGPSVFPKLSQEVLATQSVPGAGWDTSEEAAKAAKRRSVYIHIKRSLIPPELANFDFPETDNSCEARFNTVQPSQALSLMHGQFLQEQAGALADRAIAEGPADLEGRVAFTLKQVTQREPTAEDISDSLQLIDRYQTAHGLSLDAAFDQFCVMAMNLSEFVFVD